MTVAVDRLSGATHEGTPGAGGSMTARSIVMIAALLMGSCAAGPRGAAVQPAPPGPLDLVRIMFGNLSTLCPRDYEYCRGGRHFSSICCPFALGCCEGADGAPACCGGPPAMFHGGYVPPPGSAPEDGGPSEEVYEEAPPPDSLCPSSDLNCSQGGRRVCCATRDGCCVDQHGPYCCRADPGH
jgi:hypothetical protein